jgi:hypothetical protein
MNDRRTTGRSTSTGEMNSPIIRGSMIAVVVIRVCQARELEIALPSLREL